MTAQLQPLPTTAGVDGDFARRLGRLLGPAYPAPDLSTTAADILAVGHELRIASDGIAANLAEAFPSSTITLAVEWEEMLGLTPGVGTADLALRQLALVALWRTRFAGTVQAMGLALAPLNGAVPTFRETTWTEAGPIPSRVFYFTVRLAQATYDSLTLAPACRAVLDSMKPAHTDYTLTSTQMAGFFCDDPNSLTNNTVL